MRTKRSFLLAVSYLVAVGTPTDAQPTRDSRDSVVAFHNGLWVKLHHLLYMQARAGLGLDSGAAERRRAAADTAGFGSLAADEQASWIAARRFYSAHLARRNTTFDTLMIRVTRMLAVSGESNTLAGAPSDSLLILLYDVRATYERLWWPSHRKANATWIAGVQPLIRLHMQALADAARPVVGSGWPDRRVNVEVSYHTKTNGAYTPDGGPILMSSSDTAYHGSGALEMVFHEALHIAEDSLAAAASRVAKRTGAEVPYNSIHAAIFTVAGELVKARIPTYAPYVYRVGLIANERGLGPYLRRSAVAWPQFRSGALSLDEFLERTTRGIP
jgi:hypothetical protein